mmetsp:Transcript_4094/g.8775  ORF Transcript_4094/g.8775 Transcript_4094/m.8775 type:complete len:171 (-) Transcript_4094:1231-1743(-)
MAIEQSSIMNSMEKFLDHPDYIHVRNRVVLAGTCGGIGGCVFAMFRGYPMVRNIVPAALSSGMLGTACFGAERLTFMYLRSTLEGREVPRSGLLMISHTAGGFFGGSLMGTLYQGRPTNAVALCVPLMMMIGAVECRFQNSRDRRIEELAAEEARAKMPIVNDVADRTSN